jgi:hypothetical protein
VKKICFDQHPIYSGGISEDERPEGVAKVYDQIKRLDA